MECPRGKRCSFLHLKDDILEDIFSDKEIEEILELVPKKQQKSPSILKKINKMTIKGSSSDRVKRYAEREKKKQEAEVSQFTLQELTGQETGKEELISDQLDLSESEEI